MNTTEKIRPFSPSLCQLITLTACAMAGPNVATAAPVLQWKLEEGAGNFVAESISTESTVAKIVGDQERFLWVEGFAPDNSAAIWSFGSRLPDAHIDAGTLRADNSYVPGDDPGFRTLTGNYTITAWIKPVTNAGGGRRAIFSSLDGTRFYYRAGAIGSVFSDGSSNPESPTTAVKQGERHLVALIVDTSGSAVGGLPNENRIAIWDGTAWQTQDNDSSAPLDLRGMLIGAFDNPSTSTVFSGRIDEVTLFDRALTEEEVAMLYRTAQQEIAKLK